MNKWLVLILVFAVGSFALFTLYRVYYSTYYIDESTYTTTKVTSGKPVSQAHGIHREHQLPQFFTDTLQSWSRASAKEGFFNGAQGAKLYYRMYTGKDSVSATNPVVLLLPGRTEPLEKFLETIYDLVHQNYNVVALQHRGQGLSTRLGKHPHMGHVEQFDYYVQDVIAFAQQVVPSHYPDVPLYLLAHSMGGCIGTAAQIQQPNLFQKMVLVSPMFGIQLGAPWAKATTVFVLDVLHWVGKSEEWVPGGGPYKVLDFKNNDHTNSQARFKVRELVFGQAKELQIGSPTVNWVREGNAAARKVIQNASTINIPVLVLLGEDDTVVETKAHKAFCTSMGAASKNCIVHSYANAKHEILMEKDAVRALAMGNIFTFWQK